MADNVNQITYLERLSNSSIFPSLNKCLALDKDSGQSSSSPSSLLLSSSSGRTLFFYKFNCMNDSATPKKEDKTDDLEILSSNRERSLTNQTILLYDSSSKVLTSSNGFSSENNAESSRIQMSSCNYAKCVNELPPPYSISNNDHCNQNLMLSEDEALDAFQMFLTRNSCYNYNITKQISTKKIAPCHSNQYVLETFYEERSAKWHQEELNDNICFQNYGSTPAIWDIEVEVPTMFHQKEIHLEIPNTASIKDCSSCLGKGLSQCISCHGLGKMNCVVCDGFGLFHHSYHTDNRSTEKALSLTSDYRHCHFCNGGKVNCTDCSSSGRASCKLCRGKGKVKMYLRLTVKWKTLKSQKIIDNLELPSKCINKVSGVIIFQEQSDRVYPLVDFPVDTVRTMSQKTIENHLKLLSYARIIKQRHFVYEIPVYEVHSVWRRKDLKYWIYGNENDVYCQEYYKKRISCCSIL
uniref:Uncharacterized protein C3orf32 n=1 Tax=Hydra vulgaris TaxID=6087 RepID=T2M2I1_HYDVU